MSKKKWMKIMSNKRIMKSKRRMIMMAHMERIMLQLEAQAISDTC